MSIRPMSGLGIPALNQQLRVDTGWILISYACTIISCWRCPVFSRMRPSSFAQVSSRSSHSCSRGEDDVGVDSSKFGVAQMRISWGIASGKDLRSPRHC